MQFLKAGVAKEIAFGPFVDKGLPNKTTSLDISVRAAIRMAWFKNIHIFCNKLTALPSWIIFSKINSLYHKLFPPKVSFYDGMTVFNKSQEEILLCNF